MTLKRKNVDSNQQINKKLSSFSSSALVRKTNHQSASFVPVAFSSPLVRNIYALSSSEGPKKYEDTHCLPIETHSINLRLHLSLLRPCLLLDQPLSSPGQYDANWKHEQDMYPVPRDPLVALSQAICDRREFGSSTGFLKNLHFRWVQVGQVKEPENYLADPLYLEQFSFSGQLKVYSSSESLVNGFFVTQTLRVSHDDKYQRDFWLCQAGFLGGRVHSLISQWEGEESWLYPSFVLAEKADRPARTFVWLHPVTSKALLVLDERDLCFLKNFLDAFGQKVFRWNSDQADTLLLNSRVFDALASDDLLDIPVPLTRTLPPSHAKLEESNHKFRALMLILTRFLIPAHLYSSKEKEEDVQRQFFQMARQIFCSHLGYTLDRGYQLPTSSDYKDWYGVTLMRHLLVTAPLALFQRMFVYWTSSNLSTSSVFKAIALAPVALKAWGFERFAAFLADQQVLDFSDKLLSRLQRQVCYARLLCTIKNPEHLKQFLQLKITIKGKCATLHNLFSDVNARQLLWQKLSPTYTPVISPDALSSLLGFKNS